MLEEAHLAPGPGFTQHRMALLHVAHAHLLFGSVACGAACAVRAAHRDGVQLRGTRAQRQQCGTAGLHVLVERGGGSAIQQTGIGDHHCGEVAELARRQLAGQCGFHREARLGQRAQRGAQVLLIVAIGTGRDHQHLWFHMAQQREIGVVRRQAIAGRQARSQTVLPGSQFAQREPLFQWQRLAGLELRASPPACR